MSERDRQDEYARNKMNTVVRKVHGLFKDHEIETWITMQWPDGKVVQYSPHGTDAPSNKDLAAKDSTIDRRDASFYDPPDVTDLVDSSWEIEDPPELTEVARTR